MTKEKGECRKLRRGVVGELATSFPSVKARLNFSAMGRMQTKMETYPYNRSCCWARRKESKMGSKHATQTFGTQQCLLRALALEEVGGAVSLLLASAVLSNCLLCLGPGTVLGDTKDGCPQSVMNEHFFFKHHAFEKLPQSFPHHQTNLWFCLKISEPFIRSKEYTLLDETAILKI